MALSKDDKTLFGKSEPGFAFGYPASLRNYAEVNAEAGRRQKEKVKENMDPLLQTKFADSRGPALRFGKQKGKKEINGQFAADSG
jgi:hypothetical protein